MSSLVVVPTATGSRSVPAGSFEHREAWWQALLEDGLLRDGVKLLEADKDPGLFECMPPMAPIRTRWDK